MAVFLLKQVLTLLYPPAAQTDAKSGLRAINHLYKKGFFIALGHLCQTLSYPGFLGVKIPVLCSDFRRFLTEVTKLPQHNIYLWFKTADSKMSDVIDVHSRFFQTVTSIHAMGADLTV